jgi:hypothetical protein
VFPGYVGRFASRGTETSKSFIAPRAADNSIRPEPGRVAEVATREQFDLVMSRVYDGLFVYR